MELNRTWSGILPEGYIKKRFKYFYYSSNAGAVIDKSWWHQGDELLYTCQETPMKSNYYMFPDNRRTSERDLLLTRNATPYVFIPEKRSIYSNVVQRVTIDSMYNIKYVKYALDCATDSVKVNGDTIPSWNMEVWGNLYLPTPSLETQNRIVMYLDKNIDIIDKSVTVLLSQIDELNKFIDGKINEAIYVKPMKVGKTKKINRLWINEIPEDWELSKFKILFSLNKGLGITKADLTPEGLPVISYGQTHNKNYIYEFNPVDNPLPNVPEDYCLYRECIMSKGDFIFVDTSEDIKGSADFSMLNTEA